MLEKLRAVARFVDETIGWNRIGFALSVTIIVAALVVLYRMLHNIDLNEVVVALARDAGASDRAGGGCSSRPAISR